MDLNADLGERSPGPGAEHPDAALLRVVTSASIAAGFHAGEPAHIRDTIRLCKTHGVVVGAHPGFRDGQFGRVEAPLSPEDAESLVVYQVAAVAALAAAEGVRLRHVKVHGALYHMAARDGALADAVARAVMLVDRALVVFAPPGSQMVLAAEALGLRVAREAFADRAYEPDGRLVPRGRPDALITDPDRAADRAVTMATRGTVTAADGSTLTLSPDTICVHGDSPGAEAMALRVRAALLAAGVALAAPAGAA